MGRQGIKLTIGLTAIVGALAYLGTTGLRAGWVYYLSVDAYAERAETHQARARVHGTVGPGPEVHPTEFRAAFELLGESSSVQVEYRGTVPDMFAAGREVVVEGVTDERGVFVADVLLTKCGSKYAPAETAP